MPSLAWRPLAVVAALLSALLLALSPLYGYHRDELYFRFLAEHPAWGYVDQPPLTPMLAKVSIALFGDTLTGLRIPAVLCAAVLILMVGLITRELGGDRKAQVLAAAGIGTGAFTLIAGHSLLTLGADMPLWSAAILFVLRVLRRGDGRWWPAAGAAIGAATYNKHLISLLVIGLAVGVLAVGPRRILRDPWLWAGAALAVLIAAPNLIFQATNGWPQLEMAAALSADKGAEMRALFVPMQIVLFGPVVAFVAARGWLRLWRDERLRCLAVAYPVAAALTLISGGRFDYTAGLIILLFCAGVTQGLGPALAVNGAFCAIIALPLIPVSLVGMTPVPRVNEVARESIGWPEFTAAVGSAVRTLTPEERARAVILAGSYGEAGALHLAGGLPPVYSGHNQLYAYGPPPESADVAVAVKYPRRGLETVFQTCVERGRVDNAAGVDNEFRGLPVLVCRGLRMPWRAAWPRFQEYS
ncbi:glycosyltransferase family 39 protein [Nonomuraea sp. NPDC049152]|uniref:glycosyltransferase family 39 protein n=1 Tax=Nonomuraea sp. NPDC049152 TaxID=3154350 RepID=UPI0033E083AB